MAIKFSHTRVHDSVCRACSFLPVCLSKSRLANACTENRTPPQDYALDTGYHLTEPNDPLFYLYIIRTGSCKQYAITAAGKETIIDFYLPGEVIGFDALYQQKFHHFTTTLESTFVCRIKFNELKQILAQDAAVNSYVLELMSQKLLARSSIQQQQSAESRLLAFLSHMRQRACKTNHHSTLKLSMSRADIGNYLNLTTETISRIFTRLQKNGYLEVSKKLIKFTCEDEA